MDNLDTDQLMPKQFLHGIDKSGLDKGLFYNLRFTSDGEKNPACVFNKPGFEAAQIIVAGPNFGCGSSREHAVYCLQYAGVPCVLAETCSRIYYRNAINNGYPVLFVKGISQAIKDGDIKDGDVLDVDMDSGKIVNTANGKTFHGDAVSDLEHDIMEAGGLFQYMKKNAKV